MADRTVAVTLKAQVLDFVAGMKQAATATTGAKKAMQETAAAAAKHQEALRTVGVGLAAVGATAAAGLVIMVKASTEFGAKMAQLQSLSHASAGEMKQFHDAALTTGEAFGYSATQVADAEIELTKAGIGIKEQMGGALPGALALAAAGQMDVADATSIAVTAMTQFQLKGSDIPHVADLLAAGADKALGSVGDLGMALKQGGLVASQFGLSVDDTVGTLSAFANAGLIGSDAGTSFKTMLTQLAAPSTKAQELLDKYNITLNDSKGNFIGITGLAGQLQTKLGGLTQAQRNAALATIFGTDAVRAANVLYKEGASGIQGWIDKVDDTGFASAQAAGKMNSLQGDVQKLAAAFQTDLIKAGESADGALRGVVQSVTGVVKAFGALPQPVQGGVVAIGAVVAAVGLIGGAMLLAIPKIVAFRAALTELRASGINVGRVFGRGGALLAGVAAVTAGFANLATSGTASAQQVSLAGHEIRRSWAGIDKLFGKSGTGILDGGGLKESLNNLSGAGAQGAKFLDGVTMGITHLSDVYKGNEATFDAMGQQLAGLAKQNYGAAARSFSSLVSRFHLGAGEIQNLLDHMPAYRAELVAIADKNHIAATNTNLLRLAQGKGAGAAKVLAAEHRAAAAAAAKNAAALRTLAGKGDDATSSVKDLKAALDNLDGGLLDARSANRKLQQSFDDATRALKTNGRNLDINTQKGRDNQAALDDIASSAAASAKATLDAGGSAGDAAKIMANGRKHFIALATAMGMDEGKARDLAKALFGIPKNTVPKIRLDGAGSALDKLAELEHAVSKLNGKTATVTTIYRQVGTPQGRTRISGSPRVVQ
jgi:TP901 family phage tail tape measure protein